MCGIAVYIPFEHIEEGNLHIESMCDVIRHRGPDDEGYALFSENGDFRVFGGADTPNDVLDSSTLLPMAKLDSSSKFTSNMVLGHRRLSIVELSAKGHQPMSTLDQRYWIVFNGEIYNHKELRDDMAKEGITFASHSDTEVILAAYVMYGADCLNKFNGMFSFIIYDRLDCSLFAARDRFGVKPLYYWISQKGIAFASEIKQFLNLPGWNSVLNKERAHDFLATGMMDHTDETLFSGVYQFPGGFAFAGTLKLLYSKITPHGRLPVYKWYTLRAESFSGTFDDVCAELKARFRDALRLRLRSDVAVGSCLSGGLDSSSIVCMAHQLLGEEGVKGNQKTFSSCSEQSYCDEREFIEKIVKVAKVDGNYTYPKIGRLFEINELITWHQDEPYSSTSIFAQWSVFELAAKHDVKVMLDGQGSDEQLAGYHTFFGVKLASLLRAGQLKTLITEWFAIVKVHKYTHLHLAMLTASYLTSYRLSQFLRRLTRRANDTPSWFNWRLLRGDVMPNSRRSRSNASSVADFSLDQITSDSLPMLLHWEDRNSMAHSIEARVPFLDFRLVEFSLGISDKYKIDRGVTKLALRSAMRDVVPEAIASRVDKLGFATPEEYWLRNSNTADFKAALNEAINCSRGILNVAALREFDDVVVGKKPFSFQIWRAISFGLWMKVFNVHRERES
jgi:asparagine synthase (glutamine-hydrolysing)